MAILLISHSVKANSLLEDKFREELEKWGLEYSDEYYCGFYNADEKEDLVALVKDEKVMNDYGQVWVVTLDQNDELKKIIQWEVRSKTYLDTHFSVGDYDAFELIRSDHAAGYYSTSKVVIQNYQGEIRVIEMEEETRNNITNDTVFNHTIDFIDNTVFYYKQGYKDTPSIVRDYHFFIPNLASDIIIDGKKESQWDKVSWVEVEDQDYITYGQNNWSGEGDISYRVWTLVDNDAIYLYIEIKDDEIIFNDGTSLKQDHVEIWLNDIENYSSDQDDRDGLQQFGIYKSSAVKYTPEVKEMQDIEHAITPIDGGYAVEVKLELMNYLINSIENYKNLGFTIVVSDTDNRNAPAQDTLLASSKLKWGDSSTLGEIWLDWGEYSEKDFFWMIEEMYDGLWNVWD